MINYNGLFIYHNAIVNYWELCDGGLFIKHYTTLKGAKIGATAYLKKHYNGNNAQAIYYN